MHQTATPRASTPESSFSDRRRFAKASLKTNPNVSVVVTGASSGVGRAIALAFGDCAESVALIGRDSARLTEAAAEVRARGAQADCFEADLAEQGQVQELAQKLAQRYPAVSVLVHSAGVFASASVESGTVEALDRALAVNLRAPYQLTRELLPALTAGHADIVFVNSSVVGQRRAGISAYAASKQGLLAVADSLRQEVNPLGMRVLSVFLGATATPMQEAIYGQSRRPYDPTILLQPEQVAHIVLAATQTPRGAEVTDIHIRPAAPHRAG
jgi:short-subunit dehydrogenase